jgi:CRP-like cAMP-binding protein
LIVTEYRARLMFFEDIELFSNLDRTNFESLLYTIELTEVNINHVLYREGDEVDYIYVINSGEFRLEKALK